MPPPLISPSELSYLHTSLSLQSPIRPDSRSPTSFRPLVAETDLLPTTNGSARLCFADGNEAVVGVKAEVERHKTLRRTSDRHNDRTLVKSHSEDVEMGEEAEALEEHRWRQARGKGEDQWIEVTVDMPGFQRDDDGIVVFLAQMLHEGLVADAELRDRLWISEGWHWRLYVDVGCLIVITRLKDALHPNIPRLNFFLQILLLSPPHSYPLPLLSLTTHLALLSTHLPAPISRLDEDPMFNDDWDASLPLYPSSSESAVGSFPPFTLLVISVGDNIFFDPTREELAVADAICAITVGRTNSATSPQKTNEPRLRLLSLRTIDPPARVAASASTTEAGEEEGVWRPARGGMKRKTVAQMVKMVIAPGGVGEEVMKGLEAWSRS
ncbi:MAG: hypothetical protein Q9190_007757 [Brigantiaea leucoxantha]